MPRALTRLALNRGGPRDLGALGAGFAAAGEISRLLSGAEPPAEIGAALEAIAALPRRLRRDARTRRWATSLPLQKRDGGFVRAGWNAELDQMRALRDHAAPGDRRAGARPGRGDRHPLAENPAQQRAGLLHRGDRQPCRGDERHGRTAGKVHPPPDHGERHALHHGGTVGPRDKDRQCRRPRADAGTWRCSTCWPAKPWRQHEAIRAGAQALAVLDVSAALAELAAGEDWARPVVDDSLAFAIEGGRHPVVEQALRRGSGAQFVANDCDLSAGGRRTIRRDLAAHRAEHGRQVDLPAPECTDSYPGAGGLLRAGADRRISASWTGCSAASAPPTTWRAVARPSWSRWSRRQRSSTRPASARWSSWTRSGGARRPSTACRSPGRRWNTCTNRTAAGRSLPRISTR